MSDFHDWYYGFVDNPEAENKEEDRAAIAESQPAIIQQSTPLKCKCGGNLKPAIMCDKCYESDFGSGI